MTALLSFWQRHTRVLRLTLTWAAVIFVAYLFGEWFFGVNNTQLSPGAATRTFFTNFPAMLRAVIPVALQYAITVCFAVFQFVAIFWFMSRGRTYTLFPGEYDQSFDDVRGQAHIVDATRQVMQLFQGFKEFKKLGGSPPHGILLEGPPGTGKTLLAKAIAGESGVPFVYASGSSFSAMFLGVGNLRVARMFTKARRYSEKYGGCVIFIDELDSIGERRGGQAGGSGAGGLFGGMGLVNELLTQMDGIDQPKRFRRFVRRLLHRGAKQASGGHNILVVAATNRAEALDPALVRPGRFDRKIHVGVPGMDGRRDVVAYYLNKVAHAPIDIDRVVRATEGYSPAAIKNLINEALIFALRDGRQSLTFDDIWTAKLTDMIGLAEQERYDSEDARLVAVHEAAHALAGHFFRPWSPVSIVSIRKRGGAGGVTSFEDDASHFAQGSRQLAAVKVYLAGMVAEEMYVGESSSGPMSDLQGATDLAFRYVTHYGLGSQLTSLALLRSGGGNDLDAALRDEKIRDEIEAILQRCKREVRALLEEQRPALEAVRDRLLERGEITGDEFRMILWETGAISEKPRLLPQLRVQHLNGSGGNGSGRKAAGFPGVLADEPAFGDHVARSTVVDGQQQLDTGRDE